MTILVGADQRSFQVHKDKICAKSEFFADLCARQAWHQQQANTIWLANAEDPVFKAYMYWVSDGVVRLGVGADDIQGSYMRQVKLYVLGDKLGDAGFRSAVIRHIMVQMTSPTTRTYPSADVIAHLYQHITGPSPLKTLMVEMFVSRLNRDVWDQTASNFPSQFYLEVSQKALRILPIVNNEALAQRHASLSTSTTRTETFESTNGTNKRQRT